MESRNPSFHDHLSKNLFGMTRNRKKYLKSITKLEEDRDNGKELDKEQIKKIESKEKFEFVVKELSEIEELLKPLQSKSDNDVMQFFSNRIQVYKRKMDQIDALSDMKEPRKGLSEDEHVMLDSLGAIHYLLDQIMTKVELELTKQNESSTLELQKVKKEKIERMILEYDNLRIKAHLDPDTSFTHLLTDENDISPDSLAKLVEAISLIKEEVADRSKIEDAIEDWLKACKKEDFDSKDLGEGDLKLIKDIEKTVRKLCELIMDWEIKGRIIIYHEGVPLKSALAIYSKNRLIRCYYCDGCQKYYYLSRKMERPCPNDSNHKFFTLADWNQKRNLDCNHISNKWIKFPDVTTDFVVNCDGGFVKQNCCTVGVAARTQSLEFVGGFTKFYKNTNLNWDSTRVEIEALKEAIRMANRLCQNGKGIRVQIYSDCFSVVEAFNNDNFYHYFEGSNQLCIVDEQAINDCKTLMGTNENIKVQHLERELNEIADAFTKGPPPKSGSRTKAYFDKDICLHKTVRWIVYDESTLQVHRVRQDYCQTTESDDKDYYEQIRRGLTPLPRTMYEEDNNQSTAETWFEGWYLKWHGPCVHPMNDKEFPSLKKSFGRSTLNQKD